MRFKDVRMKAILMAGFLFLLLLLPLFVIEAAATEDGLAQELVSELSQEKWAAGAIAGGEPAVANAVLGLAVAPLAVTAIGPSANQVRVALSAPSPRCVGGFSDISANLTGVSYSSVAWGDYDKDGDLDILLTGRDNSNTPVAKVYRNDNGAFSDISAGLTGVYHGSAAWGDYDNDGDLDILLTGSDNSNTGVAKVYRNNNGTFTDISAGLTGVYESSGAWGDYDNDGDLDILLTGRTASTRVAKVYRNDNGAFSDISANLTGVQYSSVAWGDYDNDGYLDILLTGADSGSGTGVAKVYRNDNGAFSDISANLTGVYVSSVAWGDYDLDGDLDILLTGQDNSGTRVAKVYRNDDSIFNEISTNLTGVDYSSVAWGDYDLDGDLDILLTGRNSSGTPVAKVYSNDNGAFNEISANLTGVDYSSVAWGDYDLDGDLDILLTGEDNNGTNVAKVYKNEACSIITLPGGALDYTENDPATIIDGAATVSDDDSPDFDTGTLTVDYEANGTADDRLEIRHQGTGAGQIGVTNDTITFGGTQIATFTGGSGTTPLVITFNSNASPASAQALVRNLTYHNLSDAPSIAPRTLRMVLNDGDGSTSTPITKTINLTAVNEAPTGGNDSVTTSEDQNKSFDGSEFTFADVDGHTFNGIRIESLETAGDLEENGSDVSAGDIIEDVTNLVFTPEPNQNGTPYATFTFKVRDSSGELSANDYTMTINVTARNDAPTGGNDSVTTPEDEPETFEPSDFTFNDVDGHTFNGIRIESLETAGDLEENGSDVSVGDIIEDLSNLVFTPAANANGTPYATFTFKVRDSSGALSVNNYTMTINVTARNDAPVLDNSGDPTLSPINEDVASASNNGTLVSALIASGAGGNPISDPDLGAVEGLAVTGVDTSDGTWQFDAAGGTNWSAFNAPADDSATLLAPSATIRFVPNANFNGTASITFRAWDQTSGNNGDTGVDTSTNGGVTAFSSATESATITVNPVNDLPTGGNDSVTTPEDQNKSFSGGDFTFADVDGHTFNAIRIETIETAGDLEENGSDVSAGDIIEDVTTLVFTPEPNQNGTPYATFTFKVRDSSGELSANDYTMTINVTAVSDPPTSVSISGQTIGNIGTDYSFTASLTRPSTELPMTYTWQATGQAAIIHTTNSLNDAVSLNWQTNGLKTITVTAANSSGLVTGSHQIEIGGNIPPEARNVSINEVAVDGGSGLWLVPTAGTPITVRYDYDDPDGDDNTEQGTLIRWARGGQFELQEQPRFNEQTSIPSGITIAEERWCVTVTPHDGQNYGQPSELCAYIEQVPNLLPSAEVTISEAPDVNDPLTLTYTYDDPDGGQVRSEGASEVRWYRDDTLQSEFNNQPLIPAEQTNEGEVWCAVVKLYDGQDFGPISPPKCTIISPPGQLLPQINAEIRSYEPTDDDDLAIHTWPIGSADSSDQQSAQLACDEKALHIRWFRKGQLQPNLNNRCTVSSDLTQPGDKWWATVQPHNQFGNGRLVHTKPVYILASQTDPEVLNTQPVVREVKMRPRNPDNDDMLFLTYTYFDADGDREKDTLIRWYKNLQHISLYDGLTAIPSHETSPGEVWHAVVTPNDSQQDGDQVAAHSVLIGAGNSPPEVLFADLSPGLPGDGEDLKLRYPYYDEDGDLEGDSQVSWTVNGQARPAYNKQTVIPAAVTTVGEEWCAIVTPHDGLAYGEAKLSNCVTIQQVGQNTAPEARDAHILPAPPTSSDDLELKYDYFDVDGDLEAETTIDWYRNGELQREFDNQTLVPASQTAPGDVWYALILVHDGTDYGTKLTTPAITINKAPKITAAHLLPSPATQDQDLIVEYDYVDEDRDPDNSKILWYKDNIYQPEYNNRQTIPHQALTTGQKWYAVVTASDGYQETDVITTTEITVRCSENAFWCLYLPLILRAPEASPSASPTATFTPTPTPTPTSTPTPSIGEEPNNTQQTAQGPLISAQEYKAYPDDQDDWYYFMITEATSAEIEVTNYRAEGTVVVYKEYFDSNNRPQREMIANHGQGGARMKIPNEIDPHALSNLSPGKYLVRIYTVAGYQQEQQYRLKARYGFR